MRIAALLIALVSIAVGIAGIIFPDSLIALRRSYYATHGRFYAAGAVRLAMGLVLILTASISRWPRILRALGALMCLQALGANVFGYERAHAIMEWESTQPIALLRAGAAVTLAAGGFIVFAIRKSPSDEQSK
jgi:hypothetical protein